MKNDSVPEVTIPVGWQRCDGSIIQSPSIWAGQRTPDLNNEKRFLRGSSDDTVLTLEEDMLEDHQHFVTDPGHTHGFVDEYVEIGTSGAVYKGDTYDEYNGPTSHTKTTKRSFTGINVDFVKDSFRKGEETRPRNMHVTFIMRIF